MLIHESKTNKITGCCKSTEGMKVVDLPCNCACCKVAKALDEIDEADKIPASALNDMFLISGYQTIILMGL